MLGLVEVALSTPGHLQDIMVLIDIVPVNVPELLGIDVLDAESLYANNVTNRFVHCNVQSRPSEVLKFVDDWYIPIIRTCTLV